MRASRAPSACPPSAASHSVEYSSESTTRSNTMNAAISRRLRRRRRAGSGGLGMRSGCSAWGQAIVGFRGLFASHALRRAQHSAGDGVAARAVVLRADEWEAAANQEALVVGDPLDADDHRRPDAL